MLTTYYFEILNGCLMVCAISLAIVLFQTTEQQRVAREEDVVLTTSQKYATYVFRTAFCILVMLSVCVLAEEMVKWLNQL